MVRFAKLFLAVLLVTFALSFPAAAHTRVFLGFGFGPYLPFYDPYYYYPPPYAYYPPPVYYAPSYAPVYYTAPVAQAAPSVNCLRFDGDATNDQTGEPFYGLACVQSDGKWHIVGE